MKCVNKNAYNIAKKGLALVGMLGVVGTFTACSNPDKDANERAAREYQSAQVYAAVCNFKTEREAQNYLHKRGIYVDLSEFYEEEKNYDTPIYK